MEYIKLTENNLDKVEEGYNKLPKDAADALKKVVDEANSLK